MAVLLVVFDGFGIAAPSFGNAVWRARTPNLDAIAREGFVTSLKSSGLAVGLPWGEPGNSEVGHLTLGSGRVLYHHLPRIVLAIRDGSFFKNPAFKQAAAYVRKTGGTVHLAGLVSSGGVHAYIDHLYALLEFFKREGVTKLALHIFTDGRDAEPHEGGKFLPQLEERLRKLGLGRIASLCGRFYAMDRDGHWDRTEKAWRLLVAGEGDHAKDLVSYFEKYYPQGLSDEFIPPTLILGENTTPDIVKDGDSLVFFNFREDSERQLARAFGQKDFDGFTRATAKKIFFVTMTQYLEGLSAVVAFPLVAVSDTLGETVAGAGLKQLRIAETEKYAHVTYFFNGGKETAFPGEERRIIPSLEVSRLEAHPEMRAKEITEEIIRSSDMKEYDLMVANYANADMLGHTGNFNACVEAVEILDNEIAVIADRARAGNLTLFVTGDHGNIEEKIDPRTGRALTEHTTNPVPLYVLGPGLPEHFRGLREISPDEPRGLLSDVAPTILTVMNLPVPAAMTGHNLFS